MQETDREREREREREIAPRGDICRPSCVEEERALEKFRIGFHRSALGIGNLNSLLVLSFRNSSYARTHTQERLRTVRPPCSPGPYRGITKLENAGRIVGRMRKGNLIFRHA